MREAAGKLDLETGNERSMMEASRQAAEDALLDRTAFRLDADRFGAFMAQLDAPPAPNQRLRKFLATPAPWEK